MEAIEYRYTQGLNNLKAVIQLNSNNKYWNHANGSWQDELDSACYMQMVELNAANVYNENIDTFDFMKLYKSRIEDGLYVTGTPLLSIAPGALYSIHIYNGDKLISTTQRYKESSRRFLEMINEVQIRLGFPVSTRLKEPNAKKIGAMMNDVICDLLPTGNSTVNVKTMYHVFVPKETNSAIISPANCRNLNGLGLVKVSDSPIIQANGQSITSFITNGHGNPTSYIVSNKSNHTLSVTFDSTLQEDCYADFEVFERPAPLIFASDRTVYDSDLVIKGTEYLAKDDFGMGGDVSGRDLFLRYLTTDSNLNSDTNWSRISV